MVSVIHLRQLALSLPEATEEPHFEKNSYRVNKKIFATVDEPNRRVCVKFTVLDQSTFCSYDADIIYPVPNKWGQQGWTLIELDKIREEMLMDALETAYCGVATKRLAQPILDRKRDL